MKNFLEQHNLIVHACSHVLIRNEWLLPKVFLMTEIDFVT